MPIAKCDCIGATFIGEDALCAKDEVAVFDLFVRRLKSLNHKEFRTFGTLLGKGSEELFHVSKIVR